MLLVGMRISEYALVLMLVEKFRLVEKEAGEKQLVARRPILFKLNSLNQMALSGPAMISNGWLFVAKGNTANEPSVLMAHILPAPESVNQRLPSGPATIF